jgi:hypothetical protein
MKFLLAFVHIALITTVINGAPKGAKRDDKVKVIEYLQSYGYLPATKNKNHHISAIQLEHGVKRLQVRTKLVLFIVLIVNSSVIIFPLYRRNSLT